EPSQRHTVGTKKPNKKELKPTVQEPLEKKKHKSSHQAITKAFLDPKPVKDIAAGGAPEHFPLSPVAQSQKPTSPTRTSGKKPAIVVREDFHRDKLLLPIRDKTLLSPLRDFPVPHALVVKIELCLLSRIPQPPGKGSRQKKLDGKELPSVRKQDLEKKSTETPNKSLKKRKVRGKGAVSKFPSEMLKKELLLPPPLPPASTAQPAQQPAKMAQKRHKGESSTCSQLPATNHRTAKSKSNHKDSSSSKHRKVEGKHSEHSKSNKLGVSSPSSQQTDKVAKAFQYLEAALSFIEYGIAMESDALTPKSAYTIFTDTIDLLKFIMTLKSFPDTSASAHEKIFAVLCMRCQSILHMAMFRYKKDTAIKYSRTLNEHFKNSSRVTQAPSPCTPSPLSPMPSPASSVSSQPGSNASNCGSAGIGSSINTLHNIPSITFSYVNITSYILYAYDIWEQADALARKNKEFFAELSTAVCTLALNSSMSELVHYTRQGLQWLRLETNTP
uniref:AF4/FMR2 C-terminal homology domain-containing protein n=1 Tax=Chelydra serpentina TaxID=8475 RepID=A0A8C3S7Q6_CHESE